MISSIVQLVMRTGCALLLPALIGESGVFLRRGMRLARSGFAAGIQLFLLYEEAPDSGRTGGDLILSEFRPVIWVVISSAFFYNKKAPHSAQVISLAGVCRRMALSCSRCRAVSVSCKGRLKTPVLTLRLLQR